jgi:hypothetical protein
MVGNTLQSSLRIQTYNKVLNSYLLDILLSLLHAGDLEQPHCKRSHYSYAIGVFISDFVKAILCQTSG